MDCRESREKWECEFVKYYIQPLLSHLDLNLDAARELVVTDSTQGRTIVIKSSNQLCMCMNAGQDRLLQIIYEKNKVNKINLEPHLWSYRQRVSLEHLGVTIQDKRLKEKYPVLHEFLSVVSFYAYQILPLTCIVTYTGSCHLFIGMPFYLPIVSKAWPIRVNV